MVRASEECHELSTPSSEDTLDFDCASEAAVETHLLEDEQAMLADDPFPQPGSPAEIFQSLDTPTSPAPSPLVDPDYECLHGLLVKSMNDFTTVHGKDCADPYAPEIDENTLAYYEHTCEKYQKSSLEIQAIASGKVVSIAELNEALQVVQELYQAMNLVTAAAAGIDIYTNETVYRLMTFEPEMQKYVPLVSRLERNLIAFQALLRPS